MRSITVPLRVPSHSKIDSSLILTLYMNLNYSMKIYLVYLLIETVFCCFLQVSASDPDCGVNAMVNFTLSENSGPFSIKSATGEICLVRSLDYETRKLYEFPVVATDRGECFFGYRDNHLQGSLHVRTAT